MNWLRGDTPKQRERRARAVAHPVRSAVWLGVTWGALMWLLFVHSTNAVVVIALAGCSAFFGVATMLLMQRRWRREVGGPTP
jgi:hypothetical protein